MIHTTKAKGISLTESINSYVEEKLVRPLGKLIGKSDNPSAILDIEVGKITSHHKKGDIWRAEANLSLGKVLLRAEARGESLFAAIDLAEDEITREVRRYKGKNKTSVLRGARLAKRNATVSKVARSVQGKRK